LKFSEKFPMPDEATGSQFLRGTKNMLKRKENPIVKCLSLIKIEENRIS